MRPPEIVFPEWAQILVNLVFRRRKHALKHYAWVPDDVGDKIRDISLAPSRVLQGN